MMFIRKLNAIPEIVAGDGTRLKELLHPGRDYRFSGRYSLAFAEVAGGGWSLKHQLRNSEVYYILKGQGVMHIDDEQAEVSAGDAIEIPPGSIQWIENDSDKPLQFLCIVDPAWQVEDERILE